MATANELLALAANANSDDDVFVVDVSTRVITIPTSVTILGVESDDDVKRLHFKIPRYCGEFDLSTFDARINFENARRGGDLYVSDDLAVSPDDPNYVTFSWLVDRTAFTYRGDVKFNVCMKKYDSDGTVIKEFNTAVAKLPVLEGLETEKAVVESNPSAFDTVLFRLYAVEAATGNGRDGYYSIVKVTNDETGAMFTIIDSNGETVAYVRHGTDGYTPVKGVDYWTDAELQETKTTLSSALKTYIDNWSPDYKTVTLTAAGWVDNTQTIAIEEVGTDSVVFVSPVPTEDNYTTYNDQLIRCVAQDIGTLTFTCESAPSVDVLVNVAIYFSLGTMNGDGSFAVSDDGEGNVTIW